MKKFEAVSGDQSLFDLVGADDEHLYIIKMDMLFFSSNIKPFVGVILAERKPIEKYVPRVGDEYLSYGSKKKCIAIDATGNVWGINNDNVVCHSEADRTEFTKAEDTEEEKLLINGKCYSILAFALDGHYDTIWGCITSGNGYAQKKSCEALFNGRPVSLPVAEGGGNTAHVGVPFYLDNRKMCPKEIFQSMILVEDDILKDYFECQLNDPLPCIYTQPFCEGKTYSEIISLARKNNTP